MQIEFTDHGVVRVMERAGFRDPRNARYQIRRAWMLGGSAGTDVFCDFRLGYSYRWFDGMVYVFKAIDSEFPPIHITVLFPKGQTSWMVRAA